MNAEELQAIVEKEVARQRELRHRVAVCTAAGCLSLGADKVKASLERAVAEAELDSEVEVHGTGCLGLCHAGTMVQVESHQRPGHVCRCLYERVDAELAARLVDEHLARGTPVAGRLVDTEAPFFRKQQKVVLEGSGATDPERIESCLAAGAWQGLHLALTELTPQEVIAEIQRSGLRGRGGAGYPTGLKWSTVAKAPGARKVVICNADEGDPGAFMDRSVLEGDPHRVLEGMAIAGYAVGASQGYVYVRGEYPLAIARLKTAIKQAEKHGLLGHRVFETGFDFRVELRIGAGAFVCGEETALIASVEGRRGTPRPRPPYPAQSGLWGLPPLINNVETFANVPAVLKRGGAWLAAIGTERSKGTKVFALAGKIRNTGLIEVPMGLTLREIIFDVGGGIPDGKAFKAAQTGGPSGGCIPAQHLDLPVDYESLIQVGSFMGSGGLIVMDESSCMVAVAAYFMEFCRDESCGKCIPCRAGTVQMHALLEKICRGEGTMADLAQLEELAELLRSTSLCGLGQGAPNPVVSTLRYFRDEYLAHVNEGRCPAGVCKPGARREPPAPPAGAAGKEVRP
jgi:bidirectional [NiFe] hydrogenase diaphorase subunit